MAVKSWVCITFIKMKLHKQRTILQKYVVYCMQAIHLRRVSSKGSKPKLLLFAYYIYIYKKKKQNRHVLILFYQTTKGISIPPLSKAISKKRQAWSRAPWVSARAWACMSSPSAPPRSRASISTSTRVRAVLSTSI